MARASTSTLVAAVVAGIAIGVAVLLLRTRATSATEKAERIEPPAAAPPGMVWIPGGTFRMGSDAFLPEEGPVHEVRVDGVWMDRDEVTNRRFTEFVAATGHVTLAERLPGPAGEPPGSGVFVIAKEGPATGDHKAGCHHTPVGWRFVSGASFRHPEGPGSGIEERMDHPVVHVAYDDARAFCAWTGGRLPTEAEWEHAARGNLEGKRYTWGDEKLPNGRIMANYWQGEFPGKNSAEDGYSGTAPVGMFPANGYGLHDMAGNVWEWTQDWYTADYYSHSPRDNPRGPPEEKSADPDEPGVKKRTTRGGSFLCADNYCTRYRPSARSPLEPGTSLSHTGMRCVRDRR